jgi:hypothetical protein
LPGSMDSTRMLCSARHVSAQSMPPEFLRIIRANAGGFPQHRCRFARASQPSVASGRSEGSNRPPDTRRCETAVVSLADAPSGSNRIPDLCMVVVGCLFESMPPTRASSPSSPRSPRRKRPCLYAPVMVASRSIHPSCGWISFYAAQAPARSPQQWLRDQGITARPIRRLPDTGGRAVFSTFAIQAGA